MSFPAFALSVPPFAMLIAQAAGGNGSGVDWVTILSTYGVAAPLILYLIIDTRRKDVKIEKLETRNQSLTDAAVDKIVPLTVEATSLLREASLELKALSADRERAMALMNQATGHFDFNTLQRILRTLERVERQEERKQ